MRALGLDLATVTGFAIGDLGGEPTFGRHVLPSTGDDLGRYLIAFDDWLNGLIDSKRPDRVFFEAPILSQSTMTARKLMCLAGETERICVRRSIPVKEVVISSAKKFLTGHGYADKRMTVEAAVNRGWSVPECIPCSGEGSRGASCPCSVCDGTGRDHNQADAAAIWLFGCATLAPKVILPAPAVELPDRIKQERERKRQMRLARQNKPKAKRRKAA